MGKIENQMAKTWKHGFRVSIGSSAELGIAPAHLTVYSRDPIKADILQTLMTRGQYQLVGFMCFANVSCDNGLCHNNPNHKPHDYNDRSY